MKKHKKKKPPSYLVVWLGLVYLILQITDKLFEMVLKVLDRLSE